LLIFAKYLSLYLHIFTCTYRSTHTQAHTYTRHTRGIATTRHRSLDESGGRKALFRDKGLAHTQKREKGKETKVRKNPINTNLLKGFEHRELPAKLLDYLSGRNESNINQSSLE